MTLTKLIWIVLGAIAVLMYLAGQTFMSSS
jgi:hypothetical protein